MGWMLGYSQKAELHQAHISAPISSQSAISGHSPDKETPAHGRGHLIGQLCRLLMISRHLTAASR
jgi:hypothetical protein